MKTEKKAMQLINYWKSYKGNNIKISNGALVCASDIIVYWQGVYDKILEKQQLDADVQDAIKVLNKYYALINEND